MISVNKAYSGKKVAVLGLGSSGEAAALLLRAEGAEVTVCESKDTCVARAKATKLADHDVRVLFSQEAERDPSLYDFAVISPGIDLAAPIARNIVEKGVPIIGEIELAYRHCACPIVAITGANGKTTTTELTVHLLRGAGLRALACGNIGLPATEAVLQSEALDVLVMEVSSFQLETIVDFRPKVAAWLNLSPNHLDRYAGMDDYRAAKLRIFDNQTAEDFAVVNFINDLPMLKAQTTTFSALRDGADFSLNEGWICYRGKRVLDQSTTCLSGVHNAENIMAALAIGYCLGVSLERLATAIGDYAPPEHRCEPVTTHCGISWVNDSKSTNLDALEKAILAHSPTRGPLTQYSQNSQSPQLILIAGGKDKGFDYDALAPLVRERVRAAVLIGQMRERIVRAWSGTTECHLAETLEEAVAHAAALAREGDTVLFSPGTSSFDMFSSYNERGAKFKSAVLELIKELEVRS